MQRRGAMRLIKIWLMGPRRFTGYFVVPTGRVRFMSTHPFPEVYGQIKRRGRGIGCTALIIEPSDKALVIESSDPVPGHQDPRPCDPRRMGPLSTLAPGHVSTVGNDISLTQTQMAELGNRLCQTELDRVGRNPIKTAAPAGRRPTTSSGGCCTGHGHAGTGRMASKTLFVTNLGPGCLGLQTRPLSCWV